jgi:ATPase involved in DNA repair
MDDVLEGIILGRLDADDKLAERTRALVIGACHGADALDATLEGKAPRSPKKAGAKAASARNPAYIRSIEVQGFRGVGPPASLPITTGPGLTLVVGRNGSGKSSFAEALELLLTGDNSRWSTRSAIWKEGWRNLHQSDARIDAEFVVEGAKGTTVVSREWKPDAKLEEADTVVHLRVRRSRISRRWVGRARSRCIAPSCPTASSDRCSTPGLPLCMTPSPRSWGSRN